MGGKANQARRQASVEWFHALANHDRSEIARRCSPEFLERLRDHLALCLTGQPVPEALTPEQFAEVVLDLRANELDWERAWLAAAVKADDLVLAGQVEEAAHTLNAFAQDCPWHTPREAALREACRLQGD
ncbi:hypothetical protein [Hydrogenophaga sp.]|uniref:hypothetical protein n=1 Tax=Hydrogenophaga sp. TaxID=1904254 RepID=UPI0035B30823